MQTIILAGGRGERLRPLTDNIPKPLVPIADKPFLEYLINFLKNQGITDIVLATGYKSDLIKNYFKNGKNLGIEIIYSKEEFPLGTAGSVKKAENFIKKEDFLVLNGDSFVDINIKLMMDFHKKMGKPITIAAVSVKNPARYGQLIIKDNLVFKFKEKGEKIESNFINAGVYIFRKEVLKRIPVNKKSDFERDIFPNFSGNITAFKTEGYFIDIGIKEDYEKFKKDVSERII